MLILIKSATLTAVTREFNPSYPKGVLVANNIGLLAGALFWGLTADIVGRKWAFNVSLFTCSIFGIAAGAAYVAIPLPGEYRQLILADQTGFPSRFS
jgi:MFS family permease